MNTQEIYDRIFEEGTECQECPNKLRISGGDVGETLRDCSGSPSQCPAVEAIQEQAVEIQNLRMGEVIECINDHYPEELNAAALDSIQKNPLGLWPTLLTKSACQIALTD